MGGFFSNSFFRVFPVILCFASLLCASEVVREPPSQPDGSQESIGENLGEEEDPEIASEIEGETEAQRRLRELEEARLGEEERRRLEEEQRRLEEERLRELEEARLQEEEQRRLEEDQLARDLREARTAYQRFLWQEEDFSKAFALFDVEQNRAQREEQLKREDPDRGLFWRKEQAGLVTRELSFFMGAGKRVVLFRNDEVLQFFGFRGFLHRYRPAVSGGLLLEGETVDLGALLLKERGDYVLLVVSDDVFVDGAALDLERVRYGLLQAEIRGAVFRLVNVYSDGVGLLRVQMERDARAGTSGEFFTWAVDRMILMQAAGGG